MSFRKRKNMIGEVTSPCKKPKLLSKKSDTFPICLIHNFPSIPLFINLNHSEFPPKRSYALRKSIKHANSLFLLLICLSMIDLKTTAQSTVPRPDLNPYWASVRTLLLSAHSFNLLFKITVNNFAKQLINALPR